MSDINYAPTERPNRWISPVGGEANGPLSAPKGERSVQETIAKTMALLGAALDHLDDIEWKAKPNEANDDGEVPLPLGVLHGAEVLYQSAEQLAYRLAGLRKTLGRL